MNDRSLVVPSLCSADGLMGDAAVRTLVDIDIAKVTRSYFLMFTFSIIVKWFRDVTDRV
jgi:hypothetical protein